MEKAIPTSSPLRRAVLRYWWLIALIPILLLSLTLGALYVLKSNEVAKAEVSSTSGGDVGSIELSGTVHTGGEETEAKKELLSLINAARQDNGISTVAENELLDLSATNKVMDMITIGYWSHVAPDGTEPWTFIERAGYERAAAGENLYYGSPLQAASVVDAWLNSPTHKSVMLDAKFTEIGIGIQRANAFNGAIDTYVVAVHFASPKAGASNLQSASSVSQSSSSSSPNSSSYYSLPSYTSTPVPSAEYRPSPTLQPPPTKCENIPDTSYSSC